MVQIPGRQFREKVLPLLLGALLELMAPGGKATAQMARGLDPGKALTQYALDVWTTEQGLPQNTVSTILQTRDGYLWLGTFDGLARFDGLRFTVFTSGNTAELKNSNIRALCEDRQGNLWIGTNGGGLVRLTRGRFVHYSAREGLHNEVVWALHADEEGRVWVGTKGGGLYEVREERLLRHAFGPTAEPVSAIHRDRQGQLWVGTWGDGLWRLDPERGWTRYTVKDGLPSAIVNWLHEDREGSLWIGTTGGGLARLRGGRFLTYSKREGLPSNIVWAMDEDREGTLWIATGGGLARLRDGRFSTLTANEGLPDNAVYSLRADREGSLWIGTNAAGLARLKGGRFTNYGVREGLSHDYVYPIYQDEQDNIWVGTSEGLNLFRQGRWTSYTTRDGLCHDFVRSLAGDGEGGLWVGTYGGGLCRWRAGKWTVFTKRDGLAHDSVRAVLRDRSGRLWVGTVAGLSLLEEGRWRAFKAKDDLPSDSIICLREDRGGSLWIGTDGGGLCRYRDGRLLTYTPKDGLASSVVLCLYEDDEGTLWIGTNGGLSRFKDGRFATFTTRSGLPSDGIYQILDDGRGGLWIGTGKGVARLAKTALSDHASGRTAFLSPLTLGKADGMKSIQCTAPAQPAGWKARDGRLWFATAKGVAVLDPREVTETTEPVPVLIEALVVDEQTLEPVGPVTLPPGVERIAFHYTGLSLSASEKVRFKYKLEGFDRDWVHAAAQRVAYYTKVPPGRYRFRVVGSAGGDAWGGPEASLALSLTPRFYQTLQFSLLSLLGAVLAALGLHRLRVSRLTARQRELTTLVEERTQSLRQEKERAEDAVQEAERQRGIAEAANALKTELMGIAAHDLKNPLQAVMGLAELVGQGSRATEQVGEISGRIYGSSRRMLRLVDDLLATSALEAGQLELRKRPVDLVALAASVLEELRPRAERKQQELVLSAPECCRLEADEDRLRQVLDNLVSNAIKYSPHGRPVWLTLRSQADTVRFEVKDEGPGLDEEDALRLFGRFERLSARPTEGESQTGLGLSIVKRLVELHGGRVWAEPNEGQQGSTFVVDLPRGSAG